MQHSSLHTLKQSRFYPWLTCPPSRIWCNDQPPTPETSVGLRLQKQSLTTPSRGCRVHRAGRATRHWELAATQWTEFESNHQSSTSPGESSARLPAGLRPHRHLSCSLQSTWSAQKGTVGIKGRQSVAVPLASDFCTSISFLAFQWCQLLSKKQPWQWP